MTRNYLNDLSALLTFPFYELELLVTIIDIVSGVFFGLSIPKVVAWLV
jgi:hypothetical protein